MLGTAVRACEQSVFAVERDGADGAFDGVVVELDAAIVDEARQAFPARQRVADGFGKFALLADQAKFCPQPRFKASTSGRLFCCRTVRRSPPLWPRMSFSTAYSAAMPCLGVETGTDCQHDGDPGAASDFLLSCGGNRADAGVQRDERAAGALRRNRRGRLLHLGCLAWIDRRPFALRMCRLA